MGARSQCNEHPCSDTTVFATQLWRKFFIPSTTHSDTIVDTEVAARYAHPGTGYMGWGALHWIECPGPDLNLVVADAPIRFHISWPATGKYLAMPFYSQFFLFFQKNELKMRSASLPLLCSWALALGRSILPRGILKSCCEGDFGSRNLTSGQNHFAPSSAQVHSLPP